MEITYIDHLGDDLRVANAARVSFNKESEWEGFNDDTFHHNLKTADVKLINYLADHKHWTPFSHCMVTVRERVPIFVARQRFKHMVGFTYNEVSRRYVDDEPKFFVPDKWRSRPDGSVKQGSGEEEIETFGQFNHKIKDEYKTLLEHCEHIYHEMIKANVAPEQARMVLPQSMYTEYYTTGSLAAFARAYNLRADSHSQVEIQQLAARWDEIIRPLFPVSWPALVD